MAPVELTVVITPKSPEKGAQFLELFQKCVDYVQQHERSYVYRYEMHKGIKELNGKEQFVVLEGYTGKEGMEKHMKVPPVLGLLKVMGDLVDTQVIMTTKGAGITARL